MILPTKHIKLAESYVGLGGYILKILNKKSMSIDEIWTDFQKVNNSQLYPAYHSFDNIILGLNLLFMIGAIQIDEQGKIFYATT
jgi:hypothetical protein